MLLVVIAKFLNLFVWMTFRFSILCARFDFWLSEQSTYEPYFTDSNEMIYVTTDFFSETPTTLKNANCNYNDNHPDSYQSASKAKCTFLFFDFSVSLIKDGEAKFAIAVGLLIYFCFQVIIDFFELQNWVMEQKDKLKNKIEKELDFSDLHSLQNYDVEVSLEGEQKNSAVRNCVWTLLNPFKVLFDVANVINLTGKDDIEGQQQIPIWSWSITSTLSGCVHAVSSRIASFLEEYRSGRLIPKLIREAWRNCQTFTVVVLLNTQQSCVLFLITNLTANPYCSVVNVPTTYEIKY